MVEFGLPYASDAAISRHLAAFIRSHQTVARAASHSSDQLALPDGLILNGGVFRSPQLAQRIQELLKQWRGDECLRVLQNLHPELAVAYGAVAYAMARHGAQRRIGGGSARSFFLALEEPGQPLRGICLLPRGSEEEQEVLLHERQFLLTLDQPVRFRVFSSSADQQYAAGELIQIDDSFTPLPPLIAALQAHDLLAKTEVRVGLAASLTEVGTLRLQCLSSEAEAQRWDVEFQVRGKSQPPLSPGVALPERWPQARDRVELIFGRSKRKVDPKQVKSLRNDLEKLLGKREQWDINLLRALFDQLLAGVEQRKRSVAHERIWFNLAGFCLRPGFGDPADNWRLQQLWTLFDQGLHYDTETQSWIDWWTFWRRLAGGLDAVQQQHIFSVIEAFLNPDSLRSRKLQTQAKLMSYEDMVRLAGALEQLPASTKEIVGEWLLQRLEKASETGTSWWTLGRIGSRVPFHGSAHNVVPKQTVEEWLEILLLKDWQQNRQMMFAAVLLGRLSGDRSRDIEAGLQQRLVEKLRALKAPQAWIDMVTEVQAMGEQEVRRVFGEALPAGLRLL